MIKLLNVTYHYTEGKPDTPDQPIRGVENISFEIEPGEFVLLVGKTGAGKTSLFRLISLELTPKSGEIHLENFRSSTLSRRKLAAWRRRLGIVFQDMRLLADRTVLENVRLSAMCERNLPTKSKQRALRMLHMVGLSDKMHRLPNELSAGEQQRAAIARSVVNEPFVLLADEPVSHLDTETSTEIIDIFKQLNDSGTAMLIATHQPERFEAVASRTIRMGQGRMIPNERVIE
ncbi:MAG: ATP-binding cassette domain-containing protein [Candidatus Electryoneaceae bacterium]|nr:ATP-binding cassette domain-containing protein [Candidatus Electryoneaceae bacterium]